MSLSLIVGNKERLVVSTDSLVTRGYNNQRIFECIGKYKTFYLEDYRLYFTCVGDLRLSDGRWWYELIEKIVGSNSYARNKDLLDRISQRFIEMDFKGEVAVIDFSNRDVKVSSFLKDKNSFFIEEENFCKNEIYWMCWGMYKYAELFTNVFPLIDFNDTEYLKYYTKRCLACCIGMEEFISKFDGFLGYKGRTIAGPINMAIIENGKISFETIDIE